MLSKLMNNKFIAVTGRVRRWVENPSKIYPFSCTVVDVEDSYYDIEDDCSEFETICGSRTFVTRALKGNAGVAVDLSKLRPKGTIGSQGMEAQGCTNFMAMYSKINEEVRRGNSFKNGAVLLFLDAQHPDIIDLLNFPKSEIPWCKRAVYVGSEIFKPEMEEVKTLIIQKVANGEIFLAKRRWDKRGQRLKSNVCMEVSIPSRGTCTLTHVNLGQIQSIGDIVPAFTDTMTFLCELWKAADRSNSPFLPHEKDKNVGLGVVGLSNMLAYFGVKYSEFVGALQDALDLPITYKVTNTAQLIAGELVQAFSQAGYIAKETYGLERAFTIAPTTTSAFNHKDHRGYTTSPEISPPVAHPVTKQLVRVSDSGTEQSQYPPEVEIAGIDVPFDVYFDLAVCWQRLMDIDGLSHAISFNIWDTQVVDENFLRKWMDSPLWTTYYRWIVTQAAQDKTSLQGLSVSKEDEEFWSVDEDEETEFMSACNLDGQCTSCAG